MNILYPLIISAILFYCANRFYAGYLSRKFGEDAERKTPAIEMNDGIDYVPTRTPILFAHHYATIAGAGPIIGPTLGILYGVGPAWLWIVIGGIFFGAVHDYSSLFASIRKKGNSMAEIARKALGDKGFLLFILFTAIMLVLVTSAFLSLTAISLTSLLPLEKLGLTSEQTLLKTKLIDGQEMGIIGGIASTSVIIITLAAPLLGFLIFKRSLRTSLSFLLAGLVCILSIYVGFQFPVSMSGLVWMIVLSIYVMFASGIPVWLILQPRDFINVQILYFGLAVMFISVLIGGISGQTIAMPLFSLAEGNSHMGPVWPMLFIIIACGAISGFHSLVAGGTTSKQISGEREARTIGYGGMILESMLAVLVVITLASSLQISDYLKIAWPIVGSGNPILAFSLSIGNLINSAFGIPAALGSIIGILMVEGFVVTTLDSAVRLNRYIFEELWQNLFNNVPHILKKSWFNSGLAVVLMFLLAVTNGYKLIWPVFGASNQLLAALALIAVTVWLKLKGKESWFSLIPAIAMIITTITALLYFLIAQYIPSGNIILIVTDIILLALSTGVISLSIKSILSVKRGQLNASISS
ncbi:MAG: carbon starvation CstA family protein [Candidatus Zixiibacteriota bacterium]